MKKSPSMISNYIIMQVVSLKDDLTIPRGRMVQALVIKLLGLSLPITPEDRPGLEIALFGSI